MLTLPTGNHSTIYLSYSSPAPFQGLYTLHEVSTPHIIHPLGLYTLHDVSTPHFIHPLGLYTLHEGLYTLHEVSTPHIIHPQGLYTLHEVSTPHIIRSGTRGDGRGDLGCVRNQYENLAQRRAQKHGENREERGDSGFGEKKTKEDLTLSLGPSPLAPAKKNKRHYSQQREGRSQTPAKGEGETHWRRKVSNSKQIFKR
ncbi:hypothetical protein LR48_Vigan02g049000 [Vigna angularis]|uniref:Uncharacterized protein n=1 Tax=Phaseolus angularis TaxID=3914 RepID=A0A0L9TUV5_PHAAN|nr:hypothetical protein LR48_Vigan02g049000 [Vigna angularis]